jgi:uncharacterized membrane protein YccC
MAAATPVEVELSQALGRLPLTSALRWLARPPPAVRFGLKLGTAMAAAIWITFLSALDWGLSIWMTVLFVMQPDTGASIKKGLMRILGSVASALISIAIYGLFAQDPPLMLASLSGALALAIYGMTGPRFQYAWLVFGFTTILILAKAMAGSDQIETLAFERATLTALGVLIVFVADELFWPVRAEGALRESLAARSHQLGGSLKQHLRSLHSEQAPGEKGPPPSSPLIQQLGLVDQARDEIGVSPQRVNALSRIALLLEGLGSRTRQLKRATETRQGTPPPSVPLEGLERFADELDAALAKVSAGLTADRAPEPFAEALEHTLASLESERMAQLESLIREGTTGRDGKSGEVETARLLGVLAPILKDVVQLIRQLEDTLLGLVKHEPETEVPSGARPGAVWERFRPDPIRLSLALRAGIAGGAAIVAMLVMGWSFSEDLLPMILAPIVAFIVAGMSSTRGAGTTIGIGLAMGFLLGWLIADLSIVFLFEHLNRMPLSLVYPFVVAGGAGYLIVRGSPLGPLGARFGMLVALLPVYIGDQPATDVDGSYGMVCGLFLGLAAGLIAQRFLWPRTAMQIFAERVAGQIDLCLRALGGAEPSADSSTRGAARGKDAAGFVRAYAKQLTLLGQIHAQAHREPVERALDDERRAELLALTQDLFDATLLAPGPVAPEEGEVPEDDRAALAELRAALARQDEALRASIAAASRILRGEPPGAASDLSEASSTVETQRSELRARPNVAPALAAHRLDDFVAYAASQGELAERQGAIETWLAEWRQAASEHSSSTRSG